MSTSKKPFNFTQISSLVVTFVGGCIAAYASTDGLVEGKDILFFGVGVAMVMVGFVLIGISEVINRLDNQKEE
jgi:hypothetical protein